MPGMPPGTFRRPARRCRSLRRDARSTPKRRRRPANLTGTASGTTATLSWVASTDNVGVRVLRRVPRRRRRSARSPAPDRPSTGHHVHRQRAGREHELPVLRRGAGRAAQYLIVVATLLTATTGRACTNPVCAVTQVTTDTDIPWGLVTLPDGTILYNHGGCARPSSISIRRPEPRGPWARCPTCDEHRRRGWAARVWRSRPLRDRPLALHHAHLADRQPDRADQVGRQRVCRPSDRTGAAEGNPAQQVPQRRAVAVQPGRQVCTPAPAMRRTAPTPRTSPDSTERCCGSTRTGRCRGQPVRQLRCGVTGTETRRGLAFDSQGRLWEQEFGNSVMDETNLIVKGGNYGWPACEGTTGTCNHPRFHCAEAHLSGGGGLLLRESRSSATCCTWPASGAPGCTAR